MITNVEVLRLDPDEVDSTVDELRERIRATGHRRTRWWLPPSVPDESAARLAELGIVPHDRDPVLAGMVLTSEPPAVAGVEVRPARSLEEWLAGMAVEHDAFVQPEDVRATMRAAAERRYVEEHRSGQAPRFVALVDGEVVATAVAITASRGLFLVGGSTAPQARGRGAYRALVRARWDHAVERGTPALVVHAGRESRPILERLGFEQVTTIRLLVDSEL